MKKFNVIFCYSGRRYLLEKLNKHDVSVYSFNDPTGIFKNYIFVNELNKQVIKEIRDFDFCYILKKVGMKEPAEITLEELSEIKLIIRKEKKKLNLKNSIVKILKGAFKDQCGRCIRNDDKNAVIKTYLFNQTEINLTVPINNLAIINDK